ncbi:MAG: hypothetical protein ACT4QD_12325 [Acidobacteriota bacterium]
MTVPRLAGRAQGGLDCPCEPDVMDAVASGRWPGRDEGIAAHVAECDACRDLAEVAAAFVHARDDAAWSEAALPPSNVVWWKAQVKARQEAARFAARPMVVAQALGAACVLGVLAGMTGPAMESASSAARVFGALVTGLAASALDGGALDLVLRGVVMVIAAALTVAPVALYLAADE